MVIATGYWVSSVFGVAIIGDTVQVDQIMCVKMITPASNNQPAGGVPSRGGYKECGAMVQGRGE